MDSFGTCYFKAWLALCCVRLGSAAITWSYFKQHVESDANARFNDLTWGPGLQTAWDAVAAGKTAMYMLEITKPVTYTKIDKIQSDQEIELKERVAEEFYFFYATKEQAAALKNSQDPDVQSYVADLQAVPAPLKVLPELWQSQQTNSALTAMQDEVIIALSPGSKGNTTEAQDLANSWEHAVRSLTTGSTATFVGESPDMISLKNVRGSEMKTALYIVAAQPEAFVLAPKPLNRYDLPASTPYTQDFTRRLRRLNDEADDITQSGTIGSTPLSDAGIKGQGQVVGIADSGLDDQSCFFNGAGSTLVRNQEPQNNLRKVIQYIAYADGQAGEPNDHGTHVAGTVAGKCDRAAGTKHNGMASEAKIHFFDIGLAGQPSLSVPNNLATGLFRFAKEAGASIHTNSWGANTNRYTSNARDVDLYSWENEDFVILVAAGNSGAKGLGSVGSPATAKNCISVGASVNQKRGNIEDIASFSSLGPTADGRIKPDVVAPGHNVLSVASERTCAITSMSGTSMATPVCAGSVALVRQYFLEGRYPSGSPSTTDAFTPSGALLKAMIVHSGQTLTGNTRGVTGIPSMVQGFGRIDLDSVLKIGSTAADRGAVWIHASKVGTTRVQLQQGQAFQKSFTLNQAGNFKVTLVWMDAPAALNSRINLVNDLDLVVQTGRTTYYPNGGRWADRLNTVEMVEIVGTPGPYTVTVTARTIGSLPTQQNQPPAQPYALVVSGPFSASTNPTPNPTPSPTPTPTPNPTTPTPNPGQGSTPAPSPVSANGFMKLASGKCSDFQKAPIKDVLTCQAAAAALSLADATATLVYGAARPEGCYYFQGSRLYLSANPANAGRGTDTDGREQVCKPTTSSYLKLTNGSCAQNGLDAITESETCEIAALELGLADTSVAYIRSANRPEGCYYKSLLPGNALFMSVNTGNAGNGAAGGREQICSTTATTTTTTRTTTTTMTTTTTNNRTTTTTHTVTATASGSGGSGSYPGGVGSQTFGIAGGTTRSLTNIACFFLLVIALGFLMN